MSKSKSKSRKPPSSEELIRAIADQGKLIEAGWLGLVASAYPEGMHAEQEKQLKTAFFAGAQHLFSSVMGALDSDEEPTENDMRRMGYIHDELERWADDYAEANGLERPRSRH